MFQIQARLICFVLVIIAPFLCFAQENIKLRNDASEDVKLGKPTAFQPRSAKRAERQPDAARRASGEAGGTSLR